MHVRERDVAPLAGAWIEIVKRIGESFGTKVAPLAGAWIEIECPSQCVPALVCRSPYGSVD